ncbi:MAG TPA: hypothetical protein VGM53_32830 [Streptosporangiaceae bacterium]|jgi:hypothetical protein
MLDEDQIDEDRIAERLQELLRDPRWSIAPRPGAEARIRNVARRQRLRAVCAATGVVAVLAAAVVVPLTLMTGGSAVRSIGPGQGSSAGPVAARHAAIVIDPHVGETFARASASAAPRLTAQQAWARFAHHLRSNRTAIPAEVHVRLGLLTLPIGPTGPGHSESYTAHNELTYGYSSPPGGCPTINPRLVAPPNARCIPWTFLNANTGKQIDSTYQKVGHWHWLIDSKAP